MADLVFHTKQDDMTIVRYKKTTLCEESYVTHSISVAEIFNFRARQVTTTTAMASHNYDAAKNVFTGSTVIQNFRDIESHDDIAAAHAELVRLGGKPPALDEIFPPRALKKTEAPGYLKP
jgi:hypothetical protein